jgi:peptidoglycan/LPS O-acetylase OafA/YrhL
MAFGLARGRAIALIWLVASVGYTGFMIVDGYSFGERYYPIPAASLPFSLGAVAYHYGLQFANTRPMHATLGLAIFAFSGLFSNDLWSVPRLEGFYASLAAAALAQALLLGLSPERVPKAFVRLDSVLGDLAYPIFLAHYLIGSAVACAFAAAGADPWGLIPFAVAFVVMHAVAFGVHQLVERPIATYRDRVREVDAGDAGSRRAVGIEG